MVWVAAKDISEKKQYVCGFCNCLVASNTRFYRSENPLEDDTDNTETIFICPSCDKPTYFSNKTQVPNALPGNKVEHLPQALESLYTEARICISVSAYTASVLACRKLLMNIAVEQGAEENKKFIDYVDYIVEKGFAPPNSKSWIDHIRKRGNYATHEIALMNKEDAEELITFLEMLMKFIYEFPSRVQKKL